MNAGAGGGSQQGINLQGGAISHLAANADQLVNDVEKILGIPTRGLDALGSREAQLLWPERPPRTVLLVKKWRDAGARDAALNTHCGTSGLWPINPRTSGLRRFM